MPSPLLRLLPNHNESVGSGVPALNFNLSGCSHSGTIRISGLCASIKPAFFRKAILQFQVMIFMNINVATKSESSKEQQHFSITMFNKSLLFIPVVVTATAFSFIYVFFSVYSFYTVDVRLQPGYISTGSERKSLRSYN